MEAPDFPELEGRRGSSPEVEEPSHAGVSAETAGEQDPQGRFRRGRGSLDQIAATVFAFESSRPLSLFFTPLLAKCLDRLVETERERATRWGPRRPSVPSGEAGRCGVATMLTGGLARAAILSRALNTR